MGWVALALLPVANAYLGAGWARITLGIKKGTVGKGAGTLDPFNPPTPPPHVHAPL